MAGITHRTVETRTIPLELAEAGSGPLVLLLHGFPESAHSWRHQLVALADAGYHGVAPNQRGYGRSGRPADPAEYTMLHLTGDVVALVEALGEGPPVVVGHDWGAPVAWHTALFRPDLVRGVAGLSVPYRPRSAGPPVAGMRDRLGEGFYMVYFQTPGVAEKELEADLPATFRRLLTAAGGGGAGTMPVVPRGGGFLDVCPEPDRLPDWLTEADIAAYVADFEVSGFTGPLNWYRNLDRTWALTAAWQRAPVRPPALYIGGERDLVLAVPGARQQLERLGEAVTDLRRTILLPGCGHWTQQERPEEVNAALLEFLASLDG